MVNLVSMKNFLRIDLDMTDSDAELLILLKSAVEYVESATGKQYAANSNLMDMAVLLLVSHWFENRNMSNKTTSVQEYPHSITAIINTIKHNNADYAVKGGAVNNDI